MRTSGVKPHDPAARSAQVAQAVRALERIGAAFTVADVAERAGISRATIYRSPALRALIGAKGDGVRVVEANIHDKLCTRHDNLKAKARDLRQRLGDAETNRDEMRERAVTAERSLSLAERRIASLTALAQSGVGSPGTLGALAAKLGPEEMRRARRQLARALHPDLFAHDSAATAVATELLKTLNALAE